MLGREPCTSDAFVYIILLRLYLRKRLTRKLLPNGYIIAAR
jgi:hypothetical protein